MGDVIDIEVTAGEPLYKGMLVSHGGQGLLRMARDGDGPVFTCPRDVAAGESVVLTLPMRHPFAYKTLVEDLDAGDDED